MVAEATHQSEAAQLARVAVQDVGSLAGFRDVTGPYSHPQLSASEFSNEVVVIITGGEVRVVLRCVCHICQ